MARTSYTSLLKLAAPALILFRMYTGTTRNGSVVQHLKNKEFEAAAKSLIDIPAETVFGTSLTHDVGSFDFTEPITFWGVMIGGRIAHKVMNKTGANGGIRKLWRAMGVRRGVVL